ncbi:hypothetical protein [Alkaliphilus sp. B6464]|uniref:hypothetical protein n=1 Tax=Alkaliphilus sp. B6464 TaxID=2731219 RepID=UPI001BAA4EE4|nr:hypothetical protein [Alkaliphilus sp. B6464]QUH21749.1 hypothetical protein HYG84_17590 [Alkaliphilus sp. B6464]
MNKGDEIFVKDYKCNGDGTCTSILRPAEIAWQPSKDAELIMVRFLDEKFRKDGRALNPVQVLRKNIVTN